LVDGKHYCDYIDEVNNLKRLKKHTEAILLLRKLVEAVERESIVCGVHVAPWYYEQLAIIFRKENRIKEEIEIIERYKSMGGKQTKVTGRLTKAKALLKKTS